MLYKSLLVVGCALGPGLDRHRKSHSTGIRFLDRPGRSESLYQLRFTGLHMKHALDTKCTFNFSLQFLFKIFFPDKLCSNTRIHGEIPKLYVFMYY
jgi:hypothetical protein